jgi:hypothetical protein
MEKWNVDNMSRQIFATDTRYNKGNFPKIFRSFQERVNTIGKGSIVNYYESFLDENQETSFTRITEEIQNIYKFGRMTAWLFTQALYECCELPIKPETMFTDNPSNQSVWNGMMYFHSMEHKTVGKPPKFAGYKPTSSDRKEVLKFEKELMAEANDKIVNKKFLSYFTLETHLCQFKKLHVGHDYPGQNVGDATKRYLKFKSLWPEVNFGAFSDAVNNIMFENIRWNLESNELMFLFQKTGQLVNMNNMFPDLPDMYLETGIKKEWFSDIRNHEKDVKFCIDEYVKLNNNTFLF